MQKVDFKEYLKNNNKLDYIITEEEYITGQTWCMIKRQHVCLYFFLLFFSGIVLQLHDQIVNDRFSNSYIISLFAVVMLSVIILRIRKTARNLYKTEPHAFQIIYEKKGFTLTNMVTKESVFYGWDMIKREKDVKKLKIIYVAKYVYFFVPLKN